MLFQVTLLATLSAQPLLAAVSLSPQFEADDEEDAREELTHWLEKTGYVVAANTEPEFKALDDSGLPPEVAAVNALADENADLKQQLAAVGSGAAEQALASMTAERDDYRSKASDLLGALDAAKADVTKLAEGNNALSDLVQAEAQKVADKDSEIATLKAQLEEALKPAIVNPPAANPPTPAASPVAPADGTTPAT